MSFPHLSSLFFLAEYGIRNASKRAQTRAFLASLESLRAIEIYFGDTHRSLDWFKLDELFVGLAHQYTRLGLYAANICMSTGTLSPVLSLFCHLRTLHMYTTCADSTPSLASAFPDTLHHLSGRFRSDTLYGILKELADPTVMPKLRSVPKLHEEAQVGEDGISQGTMSNGAVERAINSLRQRNTISNLHLNEWRLWQLVDDDADSICSCDSRTSESQ